MEHTSSSSCLLLRQNTCNNCDSSEIMHVVADVKDNGLNDLYADYSFGTFGAVCNLASTTCNNILDLMHNRIGHCNKNMLVKCVESKIVRGFTIPES